MCGRLSLLLVHSWTVPQAPRDKQQTIASLTTPIPDHGSRNSLQNTGTSFHTNRADHPTKFYLKSHSNYLHLRCCLQKFDAEVDG
jgi:hypothetical protein